jgi:glutaredoxin
MSSKIKLFAISTCVYCQNTKAWLESQQVKYDAIDVDLLDNQTKFAALREIKQRCGAIAFPTLLTETTCVQGYRLAEFERMLP